MKADVSVNSKNRQGDVIGMNTSYRVSGKYNKGSFLTQSPLCVQVKFQASVFPVIAQQSGHFHPVFPWLTEQGKRELLLRQVNVLAPQWLKSLPHNSFAIINRMALPEVKEAEKGTS